MLQVEVILAVGKLAQINGVDATVLPRVVVISLHKQDVAVELTEPMLRCSSTGRVPHVTQMDYRVLRSDRLVPILYQRLVHFLDRAERPGAVFYNILVAESGYR